MKNPQEMMTIECRKRVEGYAILEDGITITEVVDDLESIGAVSYVTEKKNSEKFGEYIEFSAIIVYDIEIPQYYTLERIVYEKERAFEELEKQLQVCFLTYK